MSKHPRLIGDLFRANRVFRGLLEKSAEQTRLLHQVRSLVPSPLGTHCVAAVKKEGQLLVYVDSSAWASRLRFTTRQLSRALADTGNNIQKVTVRVLVRSQPKKTLRHPIRHLSTENADLLAQTAEQLDDPELSEALRRLTRHAR